MSQPRGYLIGGQSILIDGKVIIGSHNNAGEVKYLLYSQIEKDEWREHLCDDVDKLLEIICFEIRAGICIADPELICIRSEMTPDLDAIKEKLTEYGDVSNFATYTKEDYAKLTGLNAAEMDIYATYVVSYTSNDYIGTLVNELNEMSGVHEAIQASAKNNLLLYNLQKDGKYTFTNSDEATSDDYIKGKYKLKNGVITFTPKDSKTTTKLLYIKDNHLCGDPDCNEIYAESTETCSGKTS